MIGYDDVFNFFSMPENLVKITPKSLSFTILTPKPIDMEKGTLIDYTISLMGFPVHWRTLISDYNPPHSFIDQQIKGPYAFWHHTHTFTERGRLDTLRNKFIRQKRYIHRAPLPDVEIMLPRTARDFHKPE